MWNKGILGWNIFFWCWFCVLSLCWLSLIFPSLSSKCIFLIRITRNITSDIECSPSDGMTLQKRSHRADEYIRLVKDHLEIAVKQCIDAAGYEFDTKNQTMLIRVSEYVPNNSAYFCIIIIYVCVMDLSHAISNRVAILCTFIHNGGL